MDAVALRPFFKRKYLLTTAERRFFDVLRRVVGETLVFPKIRLADLVQADERHVRRKSNFNYIKAKHIDFVICDSTFSPRVAVELDDKSHQRADRRARDRDVNRILQIASLPILRVPVRRTYDEQEIAGQILAKIRRAKWTVHAGSAE
jgi:very-short-patch-repair endonuclease